jgi:Spy/CpxP family protein refolding chaperone
MKTSSYLLIFLLAAGGLLSAQNDSQTPPDKANRRFVIQRMDGVPGMGFGHDWWRNSELAQKIGLSEQQTQQLNQIFSSHRANLAQMRANVEIEEGKLSDLLDQDQPQQDQVLAQVTQLQNARNALEKEFTVMTLAFRGVLTPDQWKQLQSMSHEKMFFRMHKPGPGGPGDGPPPMPPLE